MPSTIVQDIASVATAVGAAFVGSQLVLARRQLTGQFEQTFVQRYESIIARIPLALILDEEAEISASARRAFYDYFELCEEELYYRSTGRVSSSTWSDWWEGIALHMRRDAFRKAWDDLKDRAVVDASGASRVRLQQFEFLRVAVAALAVNQPHDPRLRRHRSRHVLRP